MDMGVSHHVLLMFILKWKVIVLNLYASVDSELHTDISDGELNNSTDVELRLNNDGGAVGSSVDKVSHFRQNDKMMHNSEAGSTVPEGDEPHVGQEFESEAAAHAFYDEYAMHMGFITRISNLSRSTHDRSLIGRTLVCNKEGYRVLDKRDRKNLNQRPPTRVGCKAMISIKKLKTGNWVVTKFINEHNHALTPGKVRKGSYCNQYSNEHMTIQELTKELMVERKRSASYKKIIDLLFNHIEEHTQQLSEKIQHIVETVKASVRNAHQSRR